MIWNNFGCVIADVMTRFNTGQYVAAVSDFGGIAAVQLEIDDAAETLIQTMPTMIREAIQLPNLMLVEPRATSGQILTKLKILPAILGKTHVWQGPPAVFISRPVLVTDPWNNGVWAAGYVVSSTPPGAAVELNEDQFIVDPMTGQIVLTTPCNRNDQVYATYETDVESVDFKLPSLASLVSLGAAAALGAKVYPQQSSEWLYVSTMQEKYNDAIADLAKGEWTPAELRTLQWWQAPEPTETEAGTIGSVRKFRS
jgi:hypothetical protein